MDVLRKLIKPWLILSTRTVVARVVGVLVYGALPPFPERWEDFSVKRFREEIQPILEDRCYSCHGNGLKKGSLSLEAEAPGDEANLLKDRKLWSAVLENVRAGIMPPSDKPRPSADEVRLLADWVKHDVFGIDSKNPDPGARHTPQAQSNGVSQHDPRPYGNRVSNRRRVPT